MTGRLTLEHPVPLPGMAAKGGTNLGINTLTLYSNLCALVGGMLFGVFMMIIVTFLF